MCGDSAFFLAIDPNRADGSLPQNDSGAEMLRWGLASGAEGGDGLNGRGAAGRDGTGN